MPPVVDRTARAQTDDDVNQEDDTQIYELLPADVAKQLALLVEEYPQRGEEPKQRRGRASRESLGDHETEHSAANAAEQVEHDETSMTEQGFHFTSQDVQRVSVHGNVQNIDMQKVRCNKAPILTLRDVGRIVGAHLDQSVCANAAINATAENPLGNVDQHNSAQKNVGPQRLSDG